MNVVPRVPAGNKRLTQRIRCSVPAILRFFDGDTTESAGLNNGLGDNHHGCHLLLLGAEFGAEFSINLVR